MPEGSPRGMAYSLLIPLHASSRLARGQFAAAKTAPVERLATVSIQMFRFKRRGREQVELEAGSSIKRKLNVSC
jgi:hypothetical protein